MAITNSIPKIVYDAGAGDVTITFDYPPKGLDFEGKTFKAVQKVSTATNGSLQTSDNYLEDERNLKFAQVRQSIMDQLDVFMKTHALKGKAFKYYIHNAEVEFDTLKLTARGRKFRPKRTGWASDDNTFTYAFDLRMRQVI